jgi:ADP-ribosylglycohydrolase
MDLHEKIRGCLLGGAIGDYLGGPYEGQQPASEIIFFSDGRLSDDTQLSLATCEVISQCGVADPIALCGAQRLEAAGFIGVLKELVSAGGDTDTIASIAGQIMGTYLGQSQLLQELVSLLPNLDEITGIIDRFAATVAR